MVDPEGKVVALLELYGEWDAHAACVEDAELREDPHVAPFGKQGDLVAFGKAHRHQAGSDPASIDPGLFKRGFRPLLADLLAKEDMGGEFAGVMVHEFYQGRSVCHLDPVYSSIAFTSGKRPKSSASILSVMVWKSSGRFSNFTSSTFTMSRCPSYSLIQSS